MCHYFAMQTATQRKIQQYQICYGRKSGGAKEAAKTNESAASASEQQEAKSTFPHYRAPAFPSMPSSLGFPSLTYGQVSSEPVWRRLPLCLQP